MTLVKGSSFVLIITAATIGSIGCGGSNSTTPSSTATSTGGGAYFNTVSKVAGAVGPVSGNTIGGTYHPGSSEGISGAAGKWTDPTTGVTWSTGGSTSTFPSGASTDSDGNYIAYNIYAPDYWLINIYTANSSVPQCLSIGIYLDPLIPLGDRTNYFVCATTASSHDEIAASNTTSTSSASMSPSVNVCDPPSTFTVTATALDRTWGPSIVQLGSVTAGWTELDATSQTSTSMTVDAPDFSGYSTQTLQFAVFNIDGSGNYYAVGAGTLSVTNSGNCS